VFVTELAGRSTKLAHQCKPPIKQTLLAPLVPALRTALRRICMPGVEKDAPPRVPPLSQVLYPAASAVTDGVILSLPES